MFEPLTTPSMPKKQPLVPRTPQFTQSTSITQTVRAQYEAYPYPSFPLFLSLHPQEAYASHSLFAARLAEFQGYSPATLRETQPHILLAGCGDTYPYLAGRWEPSHHRLTAWDLSSRNLRRAKLRCLSLFRTIHWRQGDLENPIDTLPTQLAHIDAFGVLHHLAHPPKTLRRFSEALLPGGTLRLMVYNSRSRKWIRQWQKIFSLLGLSLNHPKDLSRAKKLLEMAARSSPALQEHLSHLAPGTLTQDSRFVDTFFHAREIQFSWKDWIHSLHQAGFQILGILDRAGELDDLPNPLWKLPDPDLMETRIGDGRFENHFEIYAIKTGGTSPHSFINASIEAPIDSLTQALTSSKLSQASLPPRPKNIWKSMFRKRLPSSWFHYEETHSLSRGIRGKVRRQIGSEFLSHLAFGKRASSSLSQNLLKLSAPTLQRLARIGAFFPDQKVASRDEENDLYIETPFEIGLKAMEGNSESADFPSSVSLSQNAELKAYAEKILTESLRNIPNGLVTSTASRRQQRLRLALLRIDASQRR
jgi:SAM-dependent methyltransferase